MTARQAQTTAAALLVTIWTLVVVSDRAVASGQWLSTMGQAALLFAITGILAWAGATTDNLIDELLGRSGGGGKGPSPKAWRIHVEDEDGPGRRR